MGTNGSVQCLENLKHGGEEGRAVEEGIYGVSKRCKILKK